MDFPLADLQVDTPKNLIPRYGGVKVFNVKHEPSFRNDDAYCPATPP